MKDIVANLREWAAVETASEREWLTDAADEIERLRADKLVLADGLLRASDRADISEAALAEAVEFLQQAYWRRDTGPPTPMELDVFLANLAHPAETPEG